MLQERKLSKKINYDVLKDLDPSAFKADAVEFTQVIIVVVIIIIFVQHCTEGYRDAEGGVIQATQEQLLKRHRGYQAVNLRLCDKDIITFWSPII